jgi:hypothetical protein
MLFTVEVKTSWYHDSLQRSRLLSFPFLVSADNHVKAVHHAVGAFDPLEIKSKAFEPGAAWYLSTLTVSVVPATSNDMAVGKSRAVVGYDSDRWPDPDK